MAQIFHPSTNTLSRLTIFGSLFAVLGLLVATYLFNKSPFVTQVDVVKNQVVPFSHEHHVRGLGIDCRYCHTTVEKSPFAGMPPTYTCMSCHSQVWTQAPMLQPVRASLAADQPLHWDRVHDLPDFVYFDHSIHVNKGVGCVSCHGRVDRMPLVRKAESMTMEWCLDCHRHPEKHLRPVSKIVDMEWQPKDQLAQGLDLIGQNHLETSLDRLTNCSTCHR
jgi:hypothetical protein